MNEVLTRKIDNLPGKPGVYMMIDSEGEIIYVGKAKILKNRVRQYFQANGSHSAKVEHMRRRIKNIDYILTDSEAEALMLECNLIKEHRPFYNILLKDDKSFPYIKLTTADYYPRLFLTRRRHSDKNKYYGPYHNAAAARSVLESVNRLYPIQMCGKKTSYGTVVGKPCLYYHIGQCLGCCTGEVEYKDYDALTDEIKNIFAGRTSRLIDKLAKEMNCEAEKLNFESAASSKAAMQSVRELFSGNQKVTKANEDDVDIVAAAFDQSIACVQVFMFREGKMIGTKTKHMSVSDDSEQDILASFLTQYYTRNIEIPAQIIVQTPPESAEAIEELLSACKNGKVRIRVPQKGDKLRLLELAGANARMNIANTRSRAENRQKKAQDELASLAGLLDITSDINRIEAYDISNIAGSHNVGAMVVFEGAKRAASQYRKFRIKFTEGQNDYASTAEIIFRRLENARKEREEAAANPKFLPLPQLILVDGGFSHVKAAIGIVKMFDFSIAVAGLVKDAKHKLRALVGSDGREIPLKQLGACARLLSEISEEVHRSAVGYHRSARSKDMIKSELTEIEGIGEKRAAELIKHFGSIDAVKRAGIEEIAKVKGMTRASAQNVFDYFNKQRKGGTDV